MKSDAQLIEASAADPDAFRVLYDRYAARVHRFLARRTGNREVALDLTAETFAQAWTSRHRFTDVADGSAGPWLFTIARRLLVASVARRQLETEGLEKLRVERRWDGAQDVVPDERWLAGMEADLEEALDCLPHGQRRALELRIIEDFSYPEVARRLSCTSTAARIRVSRGLASLRARLEEGGG